MHENHNFYCSDYFFEAYYATILLYSFLFNCMISFGYYKYSASSFSFDFTLMTSEVNFLYRRIKLWQKQLKSSASFAFLKYIVAIPLLSPLGRIYISMNQTVPQSLAILSNSYLVISKSRFLTETIFLVLLSLFQDLVSYVFNENGLIITRWADYFVVIKSSLYLRIYLSIACPVQNLKRIFPVGVPTLFFIICICEIFFLDGSMRPQISSQVHSFGKQYPQATCYEIGFIEFLLLRMI